MKGALAKGTLIAGSSRLIITLITVLSNVALARLLTPSDFGIVAIAGTISTLCISLTDVPVAALLLQIDDIKAEHFDTAWTVGFVRAIFLSLVLCALAVPVARFYGDDRLVAMMLVIGAGTLLGGLWSPRVVEFQKQLRFDVENKIRIMQRVASVGASVALAYLTRSYWALLLGTICSDLTGAVASHFYARYRPRLSRYDLRHFVRQGIWLSLTAAVTGLAERADPLIIGYFANGATLGQYSVGQRFAAIPTRETITPLTQTLFPGFARLRDNRQQLCAAYKKAQAVLFAVAFPAGVGMSLLSPFVVGRFLGPQWSESVPVMQTFAVIFAAYTLGALAQQLALGLGANRMLTIRSSVTALIRIPAIAIGIAVAGLPGCMVGIGIAFAVGLAIDMLTVEKLIGLSVAEQLSANLSTLVASTIMAGVVLALPRVLNMGAATDYSFAFSVVLVGALTYACTRALISLLSPDNTIVESELLLLYKRFRSSR